MSEEYVAGKGGSGSSGQPTKSNGQDDGTKDAKGTKVVIKGLPQSANVCRIIGYSLQSLLIESLTATRTRDGHATILTPDDEFLVYWQDENGSERHQWFALTPFGWMEVKAGAGWFFVTSRHKPPEYVRAPYGMRRLPKRIFIHNSKISHSLWKVVPELVAPEGGAS